jgi:hypothetical protein
VAVWSKWRRPRVPWSLRSDLLAETRGGRHGGAGAGEDVAEAALAFVGLLAGLAVGLGSCFRSRASAWIASGPWGNGTCGERSRNSWTTITARGITKASGTSYSCPLRSRRTATVKSVVASGWEACSASTIGRRSPPRRSFGTRRHRGRARSAAAERAAQRTGNHLGALRRNGLTDRSPRSRACARRPGGLSPCRP